MNRRDFEKTVAAGALAAAAGPGLKARAEDQDVEVAIAAVPKGASNAELEAKVEKAALAATDFGWLKKGDVVVIKPALNSGNPYPATTSPQAIKAVVRLLKDRGAGRVIVTDMSGIQYVKLVEKGLVKGSSRKLMKNAGMFEAVESAGAEIYFPEEDGWDAFYGEKPLQGSNWKGPIMMPKVARDADHIILMPRTSRHLLAGSTLGLKAAVGWWRNDTRLEYHRDAATLREKTAEANTVPVLLEKQRLVLTAASKVLATFGPDDGVVWEPDPGLVFASQSVVAHDMVSLAWLLINRDRVPAKEKDGITKDPYKSAKAVALANRAVVYLLGGAREAARAQGLPRKDINTIWDDLTLARAFQVFGGTPKVKLVDPDGSVPQDLKSELEENVTRA